MPHFDLGTDVHQNVRLLRVALGSISKPLSAAELARIVSERHPSGRAVSPSTVQRWEESVEPDIASLKVLAQLAGVSFEAFALGAETTETSAPLRAVAEPQSLTAYPITVRGVPSESVKPAEKKPGKGGGAA